MRKIALSVAALLALSACVFADTPATQSFRPGAHVALANPRGVAIDAKGTLYILDVDSKQIHKLSPEGEPSVVDAPGLSALTAPLGVTASADGTLIVPDTDANAVYRIPPVGPVASVGTTDGRAALSTPTSAAQDSKGNIFIANNGSNTIIKVTPKNESTIFAGSTGSDGNTDGAAADARFGKPRGIAVDAQDNVYVADETYGNIRKITPDGKVTTLASGFAAPRALAVDDKGNVYVCDTDNNCVRKITTDGKVTLLAGKPGDSGNIDGPAATARFASPRGICVDPAGNVYVVDADNASVREILPTGEVKTIAGP